MIRCSIIGSNWQRHRINNLLGNEYKDFFLKFKDIRCPQDYLPDGVHLKTDADVKNRLGMKKYAERIRLVLCTVSLLTTQQTVVINVRV